MLVHHEENGTQRFPKETRIVIKDITKEFASVSDRNAIHFCISDKCVHLFDLSHVGCVSRVVRAQQYFCDIFIVKLLFGFFQYIFMRKAAGQKAIYLFFVGCGEKFCLQRSL